MKEMSKSVVGVISSLLALLIFVLGLFTYQIRELNGKVEQLLIKDSSKDIMIMNNQKSISKNTFRIEQLEQMKVPATGNRFSQDDAKIMEMNIKNWTQQNFEPKRN